VSNWLLSGSNWLLSGCTLEFFQQQFGEVELPQAIKMPTRYNKGNPLSNHLDGCSPSRKRLKLHEVELTTASLQAQLRKGVATVCVLVGYESKPHPPVLHMHDCSGYPKNTSMAACGREILCLTTC